MTFREALTTTGLGPGASVYDLEIALQWAIEDYQVRTRLAPEGAVRTACQEHVAYLTATLESLGQHGRKALPHEKPGFEGPWPDEETRRERERLRQIYWQGWHANERADYAEAAARYREAAEGGLPEGHVGLAILHQLGHGVAQDFPAAARLYRAAAARRYDPAQRGLAHLYSVGTGIEEDARMYLELDLHMARHREDWARYLMGRRYEEGWAVAKDVHEALWWYRLGWEQRDFLDHLSALERLGDYTDGRPTIS